MARRKLVTYGLTYDEKFDELMVWLPQTAGPSVDVATRGEDVVVDFDRRGAVVMVEVMNASDYYPIEWLRTLGTLAPRLLTLAEASAEAAREGTPISATTLRVQIRNGRIPQAKKRGRDWVMPAEALHNYLETRYGRAMQEIAMSSKEAPDHAAAVRERAPAYRVKPKRQKKTARRR